MIRSELIDILANEKYPFARKQDIEKAVITFFDSIKDHLAESENNRAELRGLGIFSVRHRLPRKARNPKNGDGVFVDEKFVPFFKTGKSRTTMYEAIRVM